MQVVDASGRRKRPEVEPHQVDQPKGEYERWIASVFLMERGTLAVAVDIDETGRARVRNASDKERKHLVAGGGLNPDTRVRIGPALEVLDEQEIREGCPIDSDLDPMSRLGRCFGRLTWIADAVIQGWESGGTLDRQQSQQLQGWFGTIVRVAMGTFAGVDAFAKNGLAYMPTGGAVSSTGPGGMLRPGGGPRR